MAKINKNNKTGKYCLRQMHTKQLHFTQKVLRSMPEVNMVVAINWNETTGKLNFKFLVNVPGI